MNIYDTIILLMNLMLIQIEFSELWLLRIIIFYTISDFAASLTIVNIYSLKLLGEGHKVETNMNI